MAAFASSAACRALLFALAVGWASATDAAVSCAPSSGRILQDICEVDVPNPALIQFEADTIAGFLAAHQLPASAADSIYEHGRTDLRSQVRAHMLMRLLAIIHKKLRTPSEQAVVGWFEERVRQKEVGIYQTAVDERDRWMNDPCHWEPDPALAEAYGLLSYHGGAFCKPGSLLTLFSTKPHAPSKSYFLTYGFTQSYGKKIAESPFGPRALAETMTFSLVVFAFGVKGSAVVALGIAFLVGAFYKSIFPSIALATAVGKTAVTLSFGVIAGPVAIAVFAVVVGFVAAIQLYESQQTLDELATLDGELLNAQLAQVDLVAMSHDRQGMTKLGMTFVEATLPELSSTSTLPPFTNGDPFFFVLPSATPLTATLTYRDWEGDEWTARVHDGFFVQEGTENGSPVTSFSPTLRYMRGVSPLTAKRYTATIVGTNFLLANGEPAGDAQPCPVDPFTGVSDAPDLDACSAYMASSFLLLDGNNFPVVARLAQFPKFTTASSATFTNGVAKEFEIMATGAPLPAISATGVPPPGFSFVDSSVEGAGKAKIVYDGSPTTDGPTVIQLQGPNGFGIAHLSFTIQVGSTVAITSDDALTFTAGKQGSFLVTTSGSPVPAIDFTTVDCLPAGLSLTDHNDGTATVAGVPTAGDGGVPTDCSITADNGVTDASQVLHIGVLTPPAAEIDSETSVTFLAGLDNSLLVSTSGAETPVGIDLQCAPPAWLSLVDNGNGTAVLSGVPPFGTDGAFPFTVHVTTLGAEPPILDCNAPNFTLNVSDVPVFIGADRSFFGPPGSGKSINILTNQNSGVISVDGEIPPDIEFDDFGIGIGILEGFPDVGTGGIYPLVFSMTNAAGTGKQLFRLQVIEHPEFHVPESVLFFIGAQNKFALATSGFPKAAEDFFAPDNSTFVRVMEIGVAGALPPGITFSDENAFGLRTGTGLLSGVPPAGSEGAYPLTFTADNGAAPHATLDFTVFIAKAGDVNRDGVVDDRDVRAMRQAFGSRLGDPEYDHLLDTNHDGGIDRADFDFVNQSCPDPDGDGICESTTEDRDGDGIPDAGEYDPTGYFYDVHTGEIRSGGQVIVTPAPATQPFDGSDGFYQFTVSAGEVDYSLRIVAPPGCRRAACPRLDPPPFDPMGALIILGSSEDADTGFLGSAGCASNPYTLTFRLGEAGDEVLLNNIPFDCRPLTAPLLDGRGMALLVFMLIAAAYLGLRGSAQR